MRLTQKERLKELFLNNQGRPITLPEILNMHIAQYNSRILDLRRAGMDIRNYSKWENGIHKTWFIYYPHEYQQEMFRSA